MIGKKIICFVFILLVFLIPRTMAAQEDESLSFPFSTFELKNGLTVILTEDDSLPLVSVVIVYNVGSMYDSPGKSGMATLMENLMFQGSRNIGQMQHISYLSRTGGEFNAETKADKTIFSQTVPSNQLALVLWLESDRMNSLSITEPKVQEAKSRLIEDIQALKDMDPFRRSSLYFDQLLYTESAYSYPVVGSNINDVRNVTLDDMSKFYSSYYTPANAVLSIAGDIVTEKTAELVQKYFSSIPSRNQVPPLELKKPTEVEEIEQTFEEPFASLPGFHLGYRLITLFSDDYYTLSIIEYILFQGKNSRLYKRLMRERIANQMKGGLERRKDFFVMKLFVLATNAVMKDRCRRAVFSEINRMRTGLLSERELERVKNMFKANYIKQFETSLGKAVFLAESYLDRGHLENIFGELDKYMSVTAAKILAVFNRYFSKGSIFLDINIR